MHNSMLTIATKKHETENYNGDDGKIILSKVCKKSNSKKKTE